MLSLCWCIYYGDNSTYSNVEGSVFYAPAYNVIAIAMEQPKQDVPRIIQGKDYYTWRGDDYGWIGCDIGGLFDYLGQLGPRKVIQGRTITDEAFYEIVKRAVNEGYP